MSVINQKVKDFFANFRTKFTPPEWEQVQMGIDEFFPEPITTIKTGKKQKLMFQNYHSIMYQYKGGSDASFELYNKTQEGGVITDFVLLSDKAVAANAAFKVLIKVDGRVFLDESFTNLVALSSYLTYLTAQVGGTYNEVMINTIYYSKSLYIKIYESTATFAYQILQLVKKLVD